jgi:hypothetical protein
MKKYFTLKNLGWLLLLLTTFMLGNAALNKVIGAPEMISGFEFMKIPQYRIWVGLGELLALGLLLFPRTANYGAILITSFMSGAIALHLSLFGGANVHIPVIIVLLAWCGYCMRAYPNCCQSKCENKK